MNLDGRRSRNGEGSWNMRSVEFGKKKTTKAKHKGEWERTHMEEWVEKRQMIDLGDVKVHENGMRNDN